MKRLFLIAAFIVCGVSSLIAQTNCDISSLGLELRNTAGSAIVANIPADGTGSILITIVNMGTQNVAPNICSYGTGEVTAALYFLPISSPNYYCKYNGPASFVSGKYTFTWFPSANALVGTNNVPIPAGYSNGGAELNILVPISGVKVGSFPLNFELSVISASGDNTTNNSFVMPVTVSSASGSVLPVKLESIDGLGEKCNAQVKWSTSNEINLSKFEIEVSKNAVDFDRAGTIKPSSSNAGNYQFNTTQSSGKNYYRLKIIDKDGSFTYSKVITISTSCSDKVVKVFPNPVKLDQLLNVNISGYDASVKGDLYSSTGQFVKTYVLKNGANNLSVENLAQGFYTLRVSENGSITETFKLNVLK